MSSSKKLNAAQKKRQHDKVFLLIPVKPKKEQNEKRNDAISVKFSSLKYDPIFMGYSNGSKPKPSILRRPIIPPKTSEIPHVSTLQPSALSRIASTSGDVSGNLPQSTLSLRKIATIPAETYRDLISKSCAGISAPGTFTHLQNFSKVQQEIKLKDGRLLKFCGSIALPATNKTVLQNTKNALNSDPKKETEPKTFSDISEQNQEFHNYASSAPRLHVEEPAGCQQGQTTDCVQKELSIPQASIMEEPAHIHPADPEEAPIEIDVHLESASEIPFSDESQSNLVTAQSVNNSKNDEIATNANLKRKFNSILDEYRLAKCRKIYENLIIPSKKNKNKIRKTAETQTDPSITGMFECCRHLPYNGMRKERNWFYFYMHECREFSPKTRSSPTVLVDLNTCRSNKSRTARDLKMPNALQFRRLKNDPPLLTLKKYVAD